MDLPRIELSTVDATALCDPDPGQFSIDAGNSAVACFDGLTLAVAAVRSVTAEPVARMYLRRPPCVTTPCSEDELSIADVDVWTAKRAFEVHLDARLETIERPTVTSEAAWPDPSTKVRPAVTRPWLKGAPREVARRDPYPYCGGAELGDPPKVLRCFRDAVLAGRRAEMIQQVYGTEGGVIVLIYRFDGTGRLVRYYHDMSVGGDGSRHDRWERSEGDMVLGTDASRWDFEPWYGTTEQL